jgi:hypothetical protein
MGEQRYRVRDWVYIGLFGALWGGIELSLGTLLHVVFPPLANTFFTGIILIGVITALLKLVSPGGVKIGPIVAIIMESALMEGALVLFPGERAPGFITAGVLALIWNFLHRFVMLRLLYGRRFMDVAVKMAKGGSRLFGIDEIHIAAVLGVLLAVQAAAGVAAGILAWKLGGEITRRMESRYER